MRCERRKKNTENETDGTARPSSTKRAAPWTELDGNEEKEQDSQMKPSGLELGAAPVIAEDNSVVRFYKVDDLGVISPVDESSESGWDKSEREEIATVSWQELAVLSDHFLLHVFGFVLLTVTVIVLSLLYAYY